MSQNHDTMDLHDDAFEGSNDEIRISQEVFYGNADHFCSERGPSVGMTKTASEGNKMVGISFCTNSENSAVTNQALKDLCLKDADMMDFQGDFGAQSSREWSIVGARIEHDLHAKRMKLSVNELSNFKPFLDTAAASSVPVKQFVSGMYDSSLHACCQILMCHVVESTGEGVRSSCYLLKHILGSDREGNSGDGSIPDVSLSGSDGSIVKQFGGGKSIASPISQESSATKLLVSTPSAVMINKSGAKCAERRHKRDISPEPEDDDVLLTSDSMKDSRALLRSRVFHLLKRLGWSTEKRDRGCGRHRYIYRSPEGKVIREFRRVWSLFGQSVFGHSNHQVAGEDKRWSDVGHFWSDLYDTLRYIENEMDDWEPKHALVRQWKLLNPFVTVVLIDRKIHALRAGNLDKVEQRDGVDVSCTAEVKFRSKSTENNDKRSVDMCIGEIVHDSSLASDSALIDGGLKSKQEALEAYKSCSIYVSEGNSLRLVRTIDRIENQSLDTCTEEIMHNPSSLPGCVSESTSFLQINDSSSQSKFEMQAWSMDNAESDERTNNNSIQSQCLGKITRPQKREVGRKRSMACQIKDDDLLISAIIKKRSFKSNKKQCCEKSGKYELKPLKKRKSQKGGCRLLPRSLGKGSKHFKDRWSLMGERTVLLWLISTGAVFLNEAIQFRDPKDDSVVKDGHITRHGILCKCCNDVFSVSGFKIHAGFKQSRPCLNLFMGSGRPYTLCQLQAWSAEYKARRSITRSTPADEFDKNDDSCGLCGDGGELLCCDNCPSTFHQSCLSAEELPEGSWYCSNCICQICGGLVDDKETSGSNVGLKCSQCSQKYHQVCLIDKIVLRVSGSPWFCGIGCEEVYGGLQSRVGFCNPIADGYSWILLRCIHDDQKIPSPQHFALKAECNSKLAVAITIMEECFLSMSDPRTGIDMIPQVVYNWVSEFPRLDYHGFYTAVLEMDDVLVSVACIRVHGVALAEMPLIATCSKHRRQGMCRRLLDAIEKMLTSLKVQKLVIAAIPELVETWTVGFGFIPMEEDEKRSLRKVNLMVFPGTIMLKKTLCVNLPTDVKQGVKVVSPLDNDESFEMELCLEVEPIAKATIVQKSSEVVASMESQPLNTLGSSNFNDKDTSVLSTCFHIHIDLEKESERSCTFVPDDCNDLGSEIKVDNALTRQVIEDQYNGLHVDEDSKSVEAAYDPEVQSFPHNPFGKSKTVMGDKSRRIGQDSALSSLLSKSCLDELVPVIMEGHAQVPFSFTSQIESRITETDDASGLGSSVLGQVGHVRSVSEPNNNMKFDLVNSESGEEDEGDGGCMEGDGSDQGAEPQRLLHGLVR